MTSVVTFDFVRGTTTQAIRIVTIAGEPWFVAIDACKALGLSVNKGVFNHVLKLRLDEKQTVNPRTVGTLRGGAVTIISESGLYKLAMRCDNSPKARAFQDWVTREVLPEIRRTGSYSMPASDAYPEDFAGYAKVAIETARKYPEDFAGYDPVTQAIRALEARVSQAVADFERAKRDLETCTAALHALRLVPSVA